MSEKISVIVLSYGDEKELNRCIDRVLQQNYKDYELIVVSANKNTELEEKVNNNDLMTVYIKDADKLEDLRAYALSKASGDKILFLEPNDFLIDENSITTLDEVYIQKNADLLLNSFMTLKDGKFYFMGGEDEHILGDVFLFQQIENVEFRKLGGTLIKRSLFDEIDNDDLVKSDQVLLNRLSRKAQNIIFSHQNKYVYDEVAGNRLPELDNGEESELYFSDTFKIVGQNKKNGYVNKVPEKISVAFCIDENLVEKIGTLIYSIGENTSSFVDAYITYDNLSEKSLAKLAMLNKIIPTVNIKLLKVPEDQQERLGRISLKYTWLPITTYYRYVLADVLKNVDRIIYLDVDALVLGDLVDLWKIDLEGNFFGIARDPLIAGYATSTQRFVAEKNMYANAGVLLMDLKLFREHNLGNKLIDFTVNTVDYCRYGDQDVLNYYFMGAYKTLGSEWNCGIGLIDDMAEEDVKIVHFYGPGKPWGNSIFALYLIYANGKVLDMEHKYKLYQYRLLQASNDLDDKVTAIVKLDSFEYSRTLDSVLLQKYQDIEVRVIDTSHDNRVKRKVKQLQLYYPNLKYYEPEEDADTSRIINFIVKNAKEYVFFVESPYALESNAIYDLVEVGREHQADIVSAKNSIFKLSEKKYYYYASRDNEVKDVSEEDNLNSLNGCLIKKEIFDAVGALNFEDNESLTAVILEKADKVMVKHSDYLVKVVE